MGTCVRVNRDAIDLFFLERADQWVGKKVQPIFGKANRKLYRLYEATRRTEETCMHEVRVYPSVGDSDGVVRFVRFEPFKLPSGEVVGVSVSLMPTVQDSTSRKWSQHSQMTRVDSAIRTDPALSLPVKARSESVSEPQPNNQGVDRRSEFWNPAQPP